jgi:uncharacterized membrane protein
MQVATLTAFKFDSPNGAEEMLSAIKEAQQQELIQLQDAAIVTWPAGKKKPQTKQLTSMAGMGALDGAFWGFLFGLIFFVPFFGLALGAAFGALAGKMSDYGISDDFIKKVRDQVTEGTYALFLLTTGAVVDRLAEKMRGMHFELISSNLSEEQEQQLRDAFATEDISGGDAGTATDYAPDGAAAAYSPNGGAAAAGVDAATADASGGDTGASVDRSDREAGSSTS